MCMAQAPRIALIHALRESIDPITGAFTHLWPEAETFNLLDDSLSSDLAKDGQLTPAMINRFITLGRYARGIGVNGSTADAILFTCSAFGPAITAVQKDLDIPVLGPNAAAFEEALRIGRRIALLVTFQPSMVALSRELSDMAAARDLHIEIVPALVEGALAALQAGDAARHDSLIIDAALELGPVDCVVLGQFSMARAGEALQSRTRSPIITTPNAAVLSLRALLAGGMLSVSR